jgi:AcrR family transcriptional regulator
MERARKGEERQQRRQEILAAARAELMQTPFQGLQIIEVAQRAGLSKGTLYLYFESKETLGLALTEQLLGGWFIDVDDALGGSRRLAPRAIATLMWQRLEAHAPLPRLMALMPSLLEHNISLGEARRFKTWLLERVNATGQLLEEQLRHLGPGGGARLLLVTHALMVGMSGMADPAAVVSQVLAEPPLRPLRMDFRNEFIDAVEILAGSLKKAKGAPH